MTEVLRGTLEPWRSGDPADQAVAAGGHPSMVLRLEGQVRTSEFELLRVELDHTPLGDALRALVQEYGPVQLALSPGQGGYAWHVQLELDVPLRPAVPAPGPEDESGAADPGTDRTYLQGVLEQYLLAHGFAPDGSGYWGHPELGQGRTLLHCVDWQLGREAVPA